MNIFEDLIEELKEENLLETTVVETAKDKEKKEFGKNGGAPVKVEPEKQTAEVMPEKLPEIEEAVQKTNTGESDFYRRRAMDEVAFLQIVEHVFAGVEREQLKILAKPYDDLEVKKVLHNFLHLAPETTPAERSKAEFQLLQETESWHSSLALRDDRLTTGHLRRFCETSRPPLSSPALVALARFYRNSPYSEPVRNKFDLVVTRLFSRETGDSRREMVFSRDELAAHLTELYAEWSSVSLYPTDVNDDEIQKIVARFEDFKQESDEAVGFDELIKNDFFTRLHSFKRTTNETFYAPLVTAAGIECNLHIGNRYVELLEMEKRQGNDSALEDKYGFAHDSTISEATGKTFSLIELLKERKPVAPVEIKPEVLPEPVREKVPPPRIEEKKPAAQASGTNKWVIIGAFALVILIVAGVYWLTKADAPIESRDSASHAMKVSLENSMLREFLQEARLEDGTLIGVVAPAWNQMTKEKHTEVIKQMLAVGNEKGYKKVRLETKTGKAVAEADDAGIMIFE